MYLNKKVHYKSDRYLRITGKEWNGSGDDNYSAEHKILIKPNAPDMTQKWLLTDPGWQVGKAVGGGALVAIGLVVAFLLFVLTQAWIAGGIWTAIAGLGGYPLYSGAKYLSFKGNDHIFDSQTSQVHEKVIGAYRQLITAQTMLPMADRDLVTVDEVDFMREACDIMETAEQLKQLNMGLSYGEDTKLKIGLAMKELDTRATNLVAVSALASDAAMYTKSTNIISGMQTASSDMLEEAKQKHRALKALSAGSDSWFDGSGRDE